MSVKTDLQIAHGVKPRLFLQIDGLQNRIWQDDGTGTVPSWDTTGKIGLRPPSELSMSLDITTCRAEAGAMTFELDDIKDTDGLSWWGKRIAPSAWDAVNAHWRINVGSTPHVYVDANAATIPLKDSTNLPESGTLYVGQETIEYGSHATNVMAAVTKGLYPAVADTVQTFGQTYLRPQATDAGYQMHVGTVPVTWHGRRVALYTTTRDHETNSYHLPVGGVTIWTDTFDDSTGWTLDTGLGGTIAATGGHLAIDNPSGQHAMWVADQEENPLATYPLSQIATVTEALLCFEAELDCGDDGNLRLIGMCLYQDRENMYGVEFNDGAALGDYREGGFQRYMIVADVPGETSPQTNGKASAWPLTVRLYWNRHLTHSYPIENGKETLAPNGVSTYVKRKGDTTWTHELTETLPAIEPNAVGLYVRTTASAATADVHADVAKLTCTQTVAPGEGAERLWVGRISNTIKYSPRTCTWSLACESILADLERKVLNNPYKAAVKGINLTGSKGREFTILRKVEGGTPGDLRYFYSCTVQAKWYRDASELAKAVQTALDNASIIGATSNPSYPLPKVSIWDSKYVISGTYLTPTFASSWTIIPSAYKNAANVCHALYALGFFENSTGDEVTNGVYSYYSVEAKESYADDYHPCSLDCNGNKLYVDEALGFVPNQGDDSVTAGWVKGAGVTVAGGEADYLAKYSTRTHAAACDYLTLIAPQYGLEFVSWLFVAVRVDDEDDDAGEIAQIYRPCYLTAGGTARGVFEALLHPLLSTGTANYNHATYDKLPLDMSIGVQADLVDTESFLAADRDLSMAPLTDREHYYIEKAESWIDLVTREGMIFGYAVVFSRGKLRLRDIMYPSRSLAEVTIDSSNRAVRTEAPDTDMPVDTVVNAYEIKVGSVVPIKICDADSVAMFGTREITIEHPGASIATSPADLQRLVSMLLLGRPLRFPSPIVEVTLSPVLMHRVYPGDVVLFKSTCTPDPDGSGTMTVSVYALVLDAAWNHLTQAGRATLMLLVNYNLTGMPWCPAALITAHDTAVITLAANEFGKAGDPDDGTAFHDRDAVLIVERAPANRASPQSWTAAITDEYGAAGDCKFTLDTELTGYDSDLQYVMVFADYASAVAAQLDLGSWQASKTTELLNALSRAYRYG